MYGFSLDFGISPGETVVEARKITYTAHLAETQPVWMFSKEYSKPLRNNVKISHKKLSRAARYHIVL